MELNSSPIKLQDIIDIKHGFAFKGEYFKDQETNNVLVTPGNFRIGGGFKADKFKYYDGPIESEYVLKEGDLVVTMTDLSKQADTLGYSALIPRSERYTFLHNQRVGLVTIKHEDKIDKNFLYFLLRTSEYRHFIVGSATGSTVKHTSPSRILSYSCELPDIITQKKISKLLIGLEKKIDICTLLNSQLESLSQTIFKSWFVDFDPVHAKKNALEAGLTKAQSEQASMAVIAGLCSPSDYAENIKEIEKKLEERLVSIGKEKTEELKATSSLFPSEFDDSELGLIPKGWVVTSIYDLVTLYGGGTPKRSEATYWGGDIPWFSVQDVPTNSITLIDTEEKITELGLKKSSTRILPVGTTIITARGTVGKLGLTRVPMAMNQSCYGVYHKEGLGPVFNFFNLKRVVQTLQQNAHGAVFDTITHTTFQTCKVPFGGNDLPQRYENIASVLIDKMEQNQREIISLSSLRDTLLPKLLSGEINLDNIQIESEEH